MKAVRFSEFGGPEVLLAVVRGAGVTGTAGPANHEYLARWVPSRSPTA